MRAARNPGVDLGQRNQLRQRALGRVQYFRGYWATLAYDGPRTDFGKTELLAALKMAQQESLDPRRQMSASWAGAFNGQLQMLLDHVPEESAVDGDGDGKRDLWHSAPDALASAASEVASDGWQRGHVWGYEVRLPANFAYDLADGDIQKPIADWSNLGVRAADGTALPPNAESGAIYVTRRPARSPAFMTFANFKVILKYNNAHVLCAGRLACCADLIAGRARESRQLAARRATAVASDERIAFQTALLQARL